uniref:Uncharacterized protein n=1 Tax=Pelagomonas calceolata TaxID=35677 RepID=A0A7S3ZM83_9STRA|mmetsp:Transcript_17833/g.55265  ORF Transcript_17833/g.55265 Transcript_17833/m.55265 type:complete len:295 (+) Transcript_17833:51-935(+)
MSELQSFFASDSEYSEDEAQTSADLPRRVADAAASGDIDTIRRWLAAGGSPDAVLRWSDGRTYGILDFTCASSRPSNTEIVDLLLAAGVNLEGPRGGTSVEIASKYGAEATVRRLLRAGASVHGGGAQSEGRTSGVTPLHKAVIANNWGFYRDPWSIAQAKRATSLGHQGIVRMLLAHGATVDGRASSSQSTPLHIAARLAGFISLGLVKELLKNCASLDAVDFSGHVPEEVAQSRLARPIYTGNGIPEDPQSLRRPGAVEAFLALLADVRAAGSFKRYANAQSAAWKTSVVAS